jgi:hypothetical protein
MVKDLEKVRHGQAAAAGTGTGRGDNEEETRAEAWSLQAGSQMSYTRATLHGADLESGSDSSSGSESDDDDDSSDEEEEEEDAPFTYEELQARTQAARAAVNILLPNRTDDAAGREGPYGRRRRQEQQQGRDRR